MGTNYVSVACFWQFRTSVENFQVAVICEEPMPLLAGGLTNHVELHHVLSLVSGEKLAPAGNPLSMKSLQQLESGTI